MFKKWSIIIKKIVFLSLIAIMPFTAIFGTVTGKAEIVVDDLITYISEYPVLEGEIDDTPRLNRALDAIPVGGTLVLLPGTYSISSSLNWKSDMSLTGKGDNTILKVTVGGLNAVDLVDLYNVKIQSIKITGVDGTGTGKGIHLSNAKNCLLEDITVDTFENQGVVLNGASTGNVLTNIRSYNNDTSGAGCGVILWGSDVKYNYLDKIYASKNRIGVSLNGASNNILGEIIVEDNTQIGFTIDGMISNTFDGGKQNIVNSIIAKRNSTPATMHYGGVYLGNGSNENVFGSIISTDNIGMGIYVRASKNIFGKIISKGNLGDGVRIWGDQQVVQQITLDSNGWDGTTARDGLRLIKSNYTQIGNVEVTNHVGIGVRVEGSNNIFSQVTSKDNATGLKIEANSPNNEFYGLSILPKDGTQIEMVELTPIVRASGYTFKSDDEKAYTFQAGRKAADSEAWILQSLMSDLATYQNRLVVTGGQDTAVIEAQNAYLKLASVETLPEASAAYRGQMIRIEGGTGVADATYICQKKADDTYQWVQLD